MLVDDAAEDARVSAAMLSGAIAVGVMHPLVADIDDDTLRAQLLRITHRLIGAPEAMTASVRVPALGVALNPA